jgi:peroxiredoxin
MVLTVFGIVLPWIILGVGCWIGYHLMRQNGRLLLRLEAIETQLTQLASVPALRPAHRAASSQAQGLPLGSVAPEFALPDLSGEHRTLSQWRGQRLLLIFFSPRCGYCLQMASALASLPVDGVNGHPLPLVVTSGDVEANRQLIADHGLRGPVLLQEQMEVASTYQAHGTPMGYLIDPAGRIASPLTVGAEALLALASTSEYVLPVTSQQTNGHRTYKGNRLLSDSRLNRNGLTAGALAPSFTLPRLDGGDLSLEAYCGQRLLLVFSDPYCGPCDALMPQLERLHRRIPDVQVLLISRGEVEANRQKVQQHQLTFPVVLQRAWEISRLYAMFGTPIGYLIDAEGTIAADVAVGTESILALLSGTAASTNEQRRKAVPRT